MATPHQPYRKKRSLDEWIFTEDPGVKRLRLAYEADLELQKFASTAATENTKSPTVADKGKCGIHPTSSLIRMVTPDRPSASKVAETVTGPPMGRTATKFPPFLFGTPADAQDFGIEILSIHSDSSVGDANEDLKETNTATDDGLNSSDTISCTRATLTNKQQYVPSIEGAKQQMEASKVAASPGSGVVVKHSSSATTTLQFNSCETKRKSIATEMETNGDSVMNYQGNKHQREATTKKIAGSPKGSVLTSVDSSMPSITTNKQQEITFCIGAKNQIAATAETLGQNPEVFVTEKNLTITTALQSVPILGPHQTGENGKATLEDATGDPEVNCQRNGQLDYDKDYSWIGSKQRNKATKSECPKVNVQSSSDARAHSPITTTQQEENPFLVGTKRQSEATADTIGRDPQVKKNPAMLATSFQSVPIFVPHKTRDESSKGPLESATGDSEGKCLLNIQLDVDSDYSSIDSKEQSEATNAECPEGGQNSSDALTPYPIMTTEKIFLAGTKRQSEATADTFGRDPQVKKNYAISTSLQSVPTFRPHKTRESNEVPEEDKTGDPEVEFDNSPTIRISSDPSNHSQTTNTNKRVVDGAIGQVPVEDNSGLGKRWFPKVSLSSCFLFIPILAAIAVAGGFPNSEFSHGIGTLLFGTSRRSASLLFEIENTPKLTLREVLMDTETGFHLAMAPAFFGFYGYFGALASWYEMADVPLPVRSVTGASAGAMAAVLIAAGIHPKEAADFCATVTLDQFADFPGYGALFKGDKFEKMMETFLLSKAKSPPLMEESLIPVTVSAYDLRTFRGKIIREGSMARAARSSATFPLLFQPVGWKNATHDFTFIDGGIADMYGLLGLSETMDLNVANRVVNLSVGAFVGFAPPGPSVFEQHGEMANNVEVISISLEGLPKPGPLALENGPRAYAAAHEAMSKVLDAPLEPVVELGGKHVRKGHYRLVVNAVSE